MATTEHCWPIPMKAIGAQNLLTMPGGVTNSGYLHKKGGTQLQLLKWPLRFVIIHKGCVYYFKTSTSASSQGAFSLNGYNRVMRAAEETTSNNVFPFKIVHISKKHRTWYFSASSEDERKKWMSSLRKEIDHYNEKKETVTDLSDTESDTDSFYGSVERPVSIAYNQSIMDSEGSLHGYDEDDDEDGGYEQPTIDDSGIPPPNYPPPPPPGPVSSQRISGVPSKPQPPLPPQKKPFSPMDHTMVRKETPVLPQTSVKEQPTVPHLKVSGSPPVLPPISYPRTSGVERTSWNPTASPKPVLTSQKAFSPSPKDLDNALKSMNMSFQGPPPLPPYKPKTIPKSILTEHAKETPAVKDHTKPGMFRPQVLPKPMPAHKAVDPVKKTTPDKPPVPQIQRSSPDGQSFRELPTEKPRTLPRGKLSLSHEEQKDSDGDYEKVCLPMSVYVNTTDSAEVERIMRASNAGRGPLDGLYCIRDSTRAGKVLVVWDESLAKLRNYRIFEKSCEVYLEENLMFADIGCLVEHYHTNILPSHNTLILKHPYGYSRPR